MFHKLNSIIEEEKTYKKIAEYIVENDILVVDFLYEIFSRINESHKNKVLEEVCVLLEAWVSGPSGIVVPDDLQKQQTQPQPQPQQQPQPQPQQQPQAQQAQQAQQKTGLWNQISKGFGSFWNKITGKPNNPEDVVKILKKAQDFLNTNELKNAYKDELSTLANLMASVQQKHQAAQQAAQNNPEGPGSKNGG